LNKPLRITVSFFHSIIPDIDGELSCGGRFRANAVGEPAHVEPRQKEREENPSRRLRITELDVQHGGGSYLWQTAGATAKGRVGVEPGRAVFPSVRADHADLYG
jgi:hypothetical protein